MACPCCSPDCSCTAISETVGSLASVNYTLNSTNFGGYSFGETLNVGIGTGPDCVVSKTTTHFIGSAGIDSVCVNSTFPHKNNAAVRLYATFEYPCNGNPRLTIQFNDNLGASQNGIFVPGCFYCTCFSNTFLIGGDYYETMWSGTAFDTQGNPSVRTVGNLPWSGVRYGNTLQTTQAAFSNTFQMSRMLFGVNYSANYSVSVSMTFNLLP